MESLANIRRAAELDPANISYQRFLVGALTTARRWDEALAAQRRVVALLPDNLSEPARLARLIFTATGSTREGEEFFAHLTPEQANSPLGLELRRNWAGAILNDAEAVRLDKLQPYYDGFGVPRWEQAALNALNYHRMGDVAGAKARLGDMPAELRARLVREPQNVRQWVFLALMDAILGHKEEAQRGIDRAVRLMPVSRDALAGPNYAYYRALIYEIVGEKEVALAEYTRLINTPGSGIFVKELKVGHPALRGDPRWEALLNDPKNNAPLF